MKHNIQSMKTKQDSICNKVAKNIHIHKDIVIDEYNATISACVILFLFLVLSNINSKSKLNMI